jgi:hypothetical protein
MNQGSIWIDKEGRWFFQGEEITHRKTYLLYNRHLTRDGSGRILLKIGQETCPVEVEDAPFVVKTLDFIIAEQGGLKSVELILNDESKEPLIPETLRIAPNHTPYCRVRGEMFEARFSRGAYQLLIPFIQQEEKDRRFFIAIAGKKHFLS